MNKYLEFTLLDLDDVTGFNRLEIIEKNLTKSIKTDFAILLGITPRYYDKIDDLSKRTGCYFLKTYGENTTENCIYIDYDGSAGLTDIRRRNIGIRPAIKYSSLSKICLNKDIDEIIYGEYPQWAVSFKLSNELEEKYNNGVLIETGKSYTLDSLNFKDYDKKIQKREFKEYVYKDKKYIRFIGDKNCIGQKLSDGRIIEENKVYYIEVSPIKWSINRKKNIILADNILFSGVQFNNEPTNKVDFEKTDMYWYLNRIFAYDIIPSKIVNKDILLKQKDILEKLNVIKQRIESGETVELKECNDSYVLSFINNIDSKI